MTYRISADQLQTLHGNPNLKIVDCRYDFADFRLGYQSYLAGHIPNAWYLHLLDDLTGKIDQQSGALPLPTPNQFQSVLQKMGITPNSIVVAYDDHSGIYASRFWWLMQAYRHQKCYILDGGITAYQEKYPLSRAILPMEQSSYPLKSFDPRLYYNYPDLIKAIKSETITLVDVRSPDHAINQAIEPTEENLRGSIQSAHSLPFTLHIDVDGFFQSKKEIIQNFTELIIKDQPLVLYSSSGLTATYSFFALSLAQLDGKAAIYPGSWTQWSSRDECVPYSNFWEDSTNQNQ